jgi:acetyl-CoA carboxylase biotin carboxylase subunit
LAETIIDGVETTVPLFHALLDSPDVMNGNYDIHWLEHWLSAKLPGE